MLQVAQKVGSGRAIREATVLEDAVVLLGHRLYVRHLWCCRSSPTA
jgi:hypothetical protein